MIAGPDAGEWLALQRAALLAGPALLTAALLIARRPTPREATAAMVAGLWQLPALLALQVLADAAGWWRFAAMSRHLLDLPVDVWIGWALWWGPAAALMAMWLSWRIVAVAMVALDVLAMPLLTPLVVLSDSWLVGEAAAVALCLLPALAVAELTRRDRRPAIRATVHALGWGGYMLLVIPAIALAVEGRSLGALYRLPAGAADFGLLAALALCLFAGIAAAQEFAVVGGGTPIPFDPPKRVVTTGIYAHIANPMQVGSAAAMLCIGLYAGAWVLLLVAANFVIFDRCFAAWYNRRHIARAMPEAWRRYCAAVPAWRVCWRPYIDGAARLELGGRGLAAAVLRRQSAFGRGTLTAARIARHRPCRLRYCRPGAGIRADGVAAAARALEHGNLATAALGWALRLPLICPALDLAAAAAIGTHWRWRRAHAAAS